jgi:peptidoglycan glycosyltransferase
MTRRIRGVSVVLVLLLFALIGNLTYIQVFHADALKNRPDNQRLTLAEYNYERGPILVGNDAAAKSVPTKGQLAYLREYPIGPKYAAVTGFYSLIYGRTGLERATNPVLSGTDDRFLTDRLGQLFAGKTPRGGAVVTTINAAAQEAAVKGMAGRPGAVIAIDPRTGAILALYSSPTYNPNGLSSHNSSKVIDYYNRLISDPKQPLLNRPLARTYPPGSTFKLVTAAAALSSGKYTPTSVVPGPAALPLPNSAHVLTNWFKGPCGPGGKVTLTYALDISCNTAFASVGMALGPDALRQQAENFGWGHSFSVPMVAAAGNFPENPDLAETAQSAIGQFDVSATALQMALVCAGIGNNGIVMNPYLVSEELAPDLSVVGRTEPTQFRQAISAGVAAQLTAMMVTLVDHGTATSMRIPGVKVGAKTGTAEVGPGGKPHAWMVGLAPATNPQVAVAVVIENGGGAAEISGNGLAGPVASAVIKAILK